MKLYIIYLIAKGRWMTMCRIFFNPNPTMEFEQVDLNTFFSTLERVAGGDGNGICLLDEDKMYKSLAKMGSFWLFDYDDIDKRFIYHTRMATTGKVKTYNCQPLTNDKYIIAHNGVFSLHSTLKYYLGLNEKYSDSHTILRLITEHGVLNFYRGFLSRSYGVVLVYDRESEITYLLKTSGVFEAGKFKSGSYIYGSSNINFWKIEKVDELNDGMYILRKDGYKMIHQPKEDSTYNYYRRQTDLWNNGTYTGSVWDFDESTRSWKKKKEISQPDGIVDGVEFYDWYESCLDDIKLIDIYPEDYQKVYGSIITGTKNTNLIEVGKIEKKRESITLEQAQYDCEYCQNDRACRECGTYKKYLNQKYREPQCPCGVHEGCDRECGKCELIVAWQHTQEDLTDGRINYYG